MPIWFYNRPLDKADPTELRVAQIFDQLPEGWMIRWGYFYERKGQQGLRDREGDFILLGQDGRILVVEVKSGQNRHFVLSGEWEHGEDHPATQLLDEWSAVISALKGSYDGVIPYVGKALCLPHVNLTEQDRLSGELDRNCFIFGKDLEDFSSWWARHMGPCATYCKDPRKAFQSALAKGLKPGAVQLFLKQSDRLFEQFKASEYEILRMLSGNRCWMVEGGVGTGKTFLALKQAEWLAEQGEGRRILFLVFNLLLADRLKRMSDRLKLSRGVVEVRSWQELLAEIIAVEDLKLEVPSEKDARDTYFQQELPGYVRMALESGRVPASYDALVVDEAQDHDTRIEGGDEPAGWWSWYFRLLKNGAESPIAVFYDPAQRPDFRGSDRFEPGQLRLHLGGAVHVQLNKVLRYTLPIFRYLKTLNCPGTRHLIDPLRAHGDLPTGPQVEVVSVSAAAQVFSAIEGIIRKWRTQGLCRPEEIALIGPRKSLAGSSVGADGVKLNGFELADYDEHVIGKIPYLGAHRSKGMDFLAVILIDFPCFEVLAQTPERRDLQEAYVLGASRARQLLGVVHLS